MSSRDQYHATRTYVQACARVQVQASTFGMKNSWTCDTNQIQNQKRKEPRIWKRDEVDEEEGDDVVVVDDDDNDDNDVRDEIWKAEEVGVGVKEA